MGDSNFPNAYNVSYTGRMGENSTAGRPALCPARSKVQVSTFTKSNSMFQQLGLDRFFPRKSLLDNRQFNTCAVKCFALCTYKDYKEIMNTFCHLIYFSGVQVVSSAGSLLGSGLGNFIDSHDLVLRFNNAPTEHHEQDVGRKTSIRIVNSQVIIKFC